MRLHNVWFRYGRGDSWILRGVDAALAPGEVIVLSGRNGAGKSTLLRIAASLLRPTIGEVQDRPSVVGWVPERFPASQPYTVREYLTSMGRIRGLSSPGVERWADRLDLRRYLDVSLPTLSKGTAQKVGLIQALVARPDLFVLDEPWEGLDAEARSEVPALIGEVAAAGGRVLVSDHRGEAGRLPGAQHWELVDGQVTVSTDRGDDRYVVEVDVAVQDVPELLSSLRAGGHRQVRVRNP